MHKPLEDFFAVHKSGTRALKVAMHAALIDVHRAHREVQRHILLLEHALIEAETSDPDGTHRQKITWMHTRLAHLRQASDNWVRVHRELVTALEKADQSFDQDFLHVVMREEILQAPRQLAAPKVQDGPVPEDPE